MKKFLDWLNGQSTAQPVVDKRVDYPINDSLRHYLKDWQYSEALNRILSDLRDAYISYKAQSTQHPSIDFMSGSHNHGFILDVQHKAWNTQKCEALLLYWRTLLQKEAYISSMSDIRYTPKNKQQLILFRHYLKPSKRQLSPGNQRFGNIELVYKEVDSKPFYIKCQVNSYQDALYDEPEDFGQLIFLLTESA